ncbi:protein lin-37 homolog isoform X2 [Achroia grisella]|uniref:protein lin-37 homolog isoform X2 n=1 Tax=Achroia grisella TaxID=688607 RepID=UPI0027D33D42|nr:protein lin-37 homolog isoform X2 [Achroia grisella]
MPKRKRLLTPSKNKAKVNQSINHKEEDDPKGLLKFDNKEVSTARGRLKGALLEALEPTAEDSDTSLEPSPTKRDRYTNQENKSNSTSDEDERPQRKQSPQRQSYVLKLFDRSVDLSQFEEDSPLYPICRAWIANQPKADYSKFGQKFKTPEPNEDSVDLPAPEGPPVSRIPELLPEQKNRTGDNINLNYRDAVLPTREQLLQSHVSRWAAVRQAWLDQALKVEERYESTQQLLNKINVK